VKVRCRLKKTFAKTAKIDLMIRLLFRHREKIYKRICQEVLSLRISLASWSVMRKSEFGTGGSRRLRRSERGYTSATLLEEAEPFSSFLPAFLIDRNHRVQLVKRRFGTASSPGITYDKDLRVFTNGFTRP